MLRYDPIEPLLSPPNRALRPVVAVRGSLAAHADLYHELALQVRRRDQMLKPVEAQHRLVPLVLPRPHMPVALPNLVFREPDRGLRDDERHCEGRAPLG